MHYKKTFISTIGTLSALSFSIGAVAGDQAGADLFEAEALPSGFMVDKPHAGEGACGEGSCGEGSCGEEEKEKSEEGACGEGSCGEEGEESEEKSEEGTCGEGACGEGTCGTA
jgi:uncharacterized low-complexity protein